jgi:hypothetical protein
MTNVGSAESFRELRSGSVELAREPPRRRKSTLIATSNWSGVGYATLVPRELAPRSLLARKRASRVLFLDEDGIAIVQGGLRRRGAVGESAKLRALVAPCPQLLLRARPVVTQCGCHPIRYEDVRFFSACIAASSGALKSRSTQRRNSGSTTESPSQSRFFARR